MPKSKQQKHVTVDSLVSGLKSAKGVVFANFQGLTVSATENLRNLCRAENIQVVAAKKTLVKRALNDVGLDGSTTEKFQGGVATFMGMGDEVAPARIVCTFAKKNDIVAIFGGILEGKLIDSTMVKALSALPGRKELLSKMVGSLNAPVSGFVNVCAGTMRGLVTVLNAYKAKKA